ncbi:hypothetical protein Tco_0574044 [Tanacetum coccineum]
MTPYTGYPDVQGIIYQDESSRNRLMRTDELHKFSDGTLNHVRTTLNDIATGIQMDYLPKRRWSPQDKRRARVMISAIDRKLRDRRILKDGGEALKILENSVELDGCFEFSSSACALVLNSNRQQQQVPPTFVEPFNLVEPIENQAPPVVTMADNRTMAQLLEAPTKGYEDAIVVPEITTDNFELKHGLLTLVQNKQFFGHDKEDLYAHIRYFNKITSMMKFPNVPNMVKALLLDKKNQSQAPATVKAIEESCVTCGGAHSYRNCPATDGNVYRDIIQEYVSQAAAANSNQGNTGYRAPVANQIRPPGFPPVQ